MSKQSLICLLAFVILGSSTPSPALPRCTNLLDALIRTAANRGAEMGVPIPVGERILKDEKNRQTYLDLVRAFSRIHSLPHSFFQGIIDRIDHPLYFFDTRTPFQKARDKFFSLFTGRKHDPVLAGRYRLVEDVLKELQLPFPLPLKAFISKALLSHPVPKPRSTEKAAVFKQIDKTIDKIITHREHFSLAAALSELDFVKMVDLNGNPIKLGQLNRQGRRFIQDKITLESIKETIKSFLKDFYLRHAPVMIGQLQSPSERTPQQILHSNVEHWLNERKFRNSRLRKILTQIIEETTLGEPIPEIRPSEVKRNIETHLQKTLQQFAQSYQQLNPQMEAPIVIKTDTPSISPVTGTTVPAPRLPHIRKKKKRGSSNDEKKPESPEAQTSPSPTLVHEKATGVFPIENPLGMTFSDPQVEAFFKTGNARNAPWVGLKTQAERKLRTLAKITDFASLKLFPNFKEYKTKGEKYFGYYSIRIDRQFRLIFKWRDNHVVEVLIDDYHTPE